MDFGAESNFKEEFTMRRLLFATLLGLAVSSNVGCFLPAYSANPARRARQLTIESENMRNLLDEWERFWFLDQPEHMTPLRNHGGIL
jgi:hypothetical protein